MKRRTLLATAAAVAALAAGYGPSQAAEPLGKGMTMYVQMGGNAGDGATWARTNGALAAGEAFGIKIIEQYSAWQPEKMLEQFRQAVAAKPDCIEIMGHPGNDAFEPLVKQARDRGILITVGNSPLTKIQKMYGSKGTGYAGVELYAGGAITASKMLEAGLKSGDKALVYGLLSEAERGQSDKGLKDTLEKAGVKVDYIEISAEVNADSSLAVPVLTAYLAKNPKLADDFVKISQKAFAACVADAAPCLKALLDQVSGLDKQSQERQWERIKFLMTDEFTTTKGLGWIDGERMKKDYDLVQTYLGMEKPFDVGTAFSTKMLDPAIKMDASKVKK
jgi:ABC-type sugar transport system substrate-binding protein